jgi:hypothetical protein
VSLIAARLFSDSGHRYLEFPLDMDVMNRMKSDLPQIVNGRLRID